MISPRENHEDYQAALAWVGRQVEEAERQGLTLEYVGGWQTYQPDPKTLERAWRVLSGIPESMTHLLTSPQAQWEQVLLRWVRHHPEQGYAWFGHVLSNEDQEAFDRLFDINPHICL